ncbi:MAG: 8-amino-7-oxononanoate synthase [Nitrospirae bacterium]|nr:8-amino-7-oxononanoate synthase [Nitrospirota bacterium]
MENVKWFDAELKELKTKNLLRKLTCIDASKGSGILISGKEYIDFSSNDYLDLSRHPEIIKTAFKALKEYGFGSGASRLLSGTYLPHIKLEERIAKFKKTGAALIFNTGYAANSGIIPAVTGADAIIFSDALNHASIVDGIRLSKAKVRIYRHRDADHLETLLKKSRTDKSVKRRLIVTDTVFSMDGDIAPLNDIVSLSRKYGATLMIDDAHATGVIGRNGKGGLEHFGIKDEGVVQMGTFSKAFGCFGAYVAGSADLINLLTNKARSFMYSTSLPPAFASAAAKAIDIVEFKSEHIRKRLWKNRQRLYQGLRSLGYDTLASETPVIPVLVGDTKSALAISKYLFKEKIFAPAIRPPTVPEGKSRMRFSVTSAHTDEDIDRVLGKLRKLKN